MKEKEQDIETNISEEKPKSKNNHTALIAIVILVLVAAIGYRGYYFYKKMQVSNPVKITTNKIMELANESNKVLKDSNFFAKNKTTKMTIDGKIADYKINVESGFDLKNNLVQILADVNAGNDNLLYLDGSVKKDSAIFQVAKNSNSYMINSNFSDLFDYLLDYTDLLNNDFNEKTAKYLAESFEENFKKEDFTKSKEKLTILDKEMNTTKYETTIDEEDIANVLSTFIDKLSKDDDFIKAVVDSAKSMGQDLTAADVKAVLYEAKGSFDDLEKISIKYTIYVKGVDVVRFSFDIKDQSIKLNIDTYKNKSNISIEMPGSNISLDYDKKSTEYEISVNKVSFVNGTYKEKTSKNNVSVNLTFSIPLMGIDGELNSKIVVTDALKEKNYNNPLDVTEPKNAEKLMEEIEDNEFITGLISSLSDMFSNQTNWDSVDGIEF